MKHIVAIFQVNALLSSFPGNEWNSKRIQSARYSNT